MQFFNAEAISVLLPMDTAIATMRTAMVSVSSQTVSMLPRVIAPLAGASGHLGVMIASATSPAIFGVKVVSLLPNNPANGLPLIQGILLLFNSINGMPLAGFDGAAVTATRTAAASGLATQLLSREHARSHGILGTGPQAYMHAIAILAARPELDVSWIWGRDRAKANRLADRLGKDTGREFRVAATAEEACNQDIISTTTSSQTPVLEGRWIRPGTHINLVGSHHPSAREADTLAVSQASVFVDHLPSTLVEAGDILIPVAEGAFDTADIMGEIGSVATGAIPGRLRDDEITLYKSLGVAAQDVFAAWAILEATAKPEGNPARPS